MLAKATNELKTSEKNRGAELVVDCLVEQGVTHVFGIPGAKIDAVFDALKDKGPELVLCRHEQNAAFMVMGCRKTDWKTRRLSRYFRPGGIQLGDRLVNG